jgi:pimeloyl-ACP methyl ester carboxylesterase
VQIQSDDIELHYEVTGEGFPIVLLHPFPVHHGFWSPVTRQLAERYRVITPDLRAHGLSGVGKGAAATMARHAADLLRLIDAEQVHHAVYVGLSIGGYILFEFWRKSRDRVSALVFADTRAEADTDQGRAKRLKSIEDSRSAGTAPFIEAQLENLIGASTRRNRPDLVAKARAMMQGLTPDRLAALQEGMANRPDSVPTLQTINVPTLVIAGDEDTLTPLSDAQLMQSKIRNARLTVIPRVGHYSALENPEEFGRLLRQFLDGLQLIR